MNLLKDLADMLRSQVKAQGYDVDHVKSDDHVALMLYSKVQRYSIEARPREILKAVGFQCPQEHALGLQQLEEAIQSGKSLVPYRSRGMKKTTRLDPLLDCWGIHHFHLGINLDESGFVERTRELLFCLFDGEYAYFLKVATHDSSPWTKKELVEIIHQSWPDVLEPYRLNGVTSLAHNLSDDERKELRKANLLTFLDMKDGTIYIEPGLGNTSGGLHIQDLRWADSMRQVSETVESYIVTNWDEIVDDAKKQNCYPKEANQLVLMDSTIPELCWDIREPESGYWFRLDVRPRPL